MLLFGLYEGERITLDVDVGQTVKEVREMIQKMLNISVDQYKHDKKVLVLSWGGSDLQDPWIFSDLGIVPGTTIRVNLKEEVKPVLYIHCSHSQDTLPVFDMHQIQHLHLEEMRSLAARMSGLPIGIFRLVTKDGLEMYDGHCLEDYGVDVGHVIYLENLDGWNEFINLAIMGFTPQVLSQISQEETGGRYQMKVALWLAAHFGHVDLARAMLRQGIKASEPIGYPPQRMWCIDDGHIDSKKAPVHEAVEMGQLGVLRLFVNTDITVITAKDGYDLAPLNIALRKKVKNCASFLLTKQWSKINITKHFALHIGTYTHLKQWCERAKEKTFTKFGHSKSSLKRRPFQPAPLVGFGVHVDGFSTSIMTGKSKAQLQKEREKDRKSKLAYRPSQTQLNTADVAEDPEAYFKQMNAVNALRAMGSKVKTGRWGRMASKANIASDVLSLARSQVAAESTKTQKTPEPPAKANGEFGGGGGEDTVRLPPITQKSVRHRLVSQSQLSVVSTSSDVKDGGPPQQQQSAGEKKGEGDKGHMMSKLVKTRGSAYFMAGSGTQPLGGKVPNPPAPSKAEATQDAVATRGRSHAGSISTASTITNNTGEDGGEGSTNLNASMGKKDPPTARTDANSEGKTPGKENAKKKKKGRVTSSLLLSKAKSTDGNIPLPLVSHEQDRRPFFYYNGQREDDLVEPAISSWSKHADAGATPRERAIRSLTVANTFKDKPWLAQVQIALRLAANPTKRNIRRLRSASKRALALHNNSFSTV